MLKANATKVTMLFPLLGNDGEPFSAGVWAWWLDNIVTFGAYHELERFDGDPAFRDRLSARVAEHIKVLRHKITDRGLVSADTRLSDEVVVRLLIEHGIVTAADLGKLNDPAWCSRQEDLWWSRDG